jgi:hypothetical protein
VQKCHYTVVQTAAVMNELVARKLVHISPPGYARTIQLSLTRTTDKQEVSRHACVDSRVAADVTTF